MTTVRRAPLLSTVTESVATFDFAVADSTGNGYV